MILRLIKVIWFLSVLAALGSLLWVYAGLPEQVILQEDVKGRIEGSRELVFYVSTAVLLIINVLVYLVKKLAFREEDFRAWFHGLLITINIFFIVAIQFVQIYNSTEGYDFSHIGIIVYGSIGLIVLWSLTWPVYSIYRKNSVKQAVL